MQKLGVGAEYFTSHDVMHHGLNPCRKWTQRHIHNVFNGKPIMQRIKAPSLFSYLLFLLLLIDNLPGLTQQTVCGV